MTAAMNRTPRRFSEEGITDPDRCLICHLDDSDDEAVVFRSDTWACEVAAGYEVPGWFFLRIRRHALGWTALETDELTEFGPVVQRLMTALETAFDAPACYLMTFGEAYPHFHCIITVRGDDVPPERRSGAILGLRANGVDRAAALRHVPAVRSAYRDAGRLPAAADDATTASTDSL